MKTGEIKDERVVNGVRQARSEFAVLFYYLSAILIFVKILFLHFGFKDIVAEYIYVLGFPIYQLIRCYTLKVDMYSVLDGRKRYKQLIYGFIAVVIATLIYGYMAYTKKQFNVEETGVFVLFFIVAFVGARLLLGLYQKKIQKKIDEDM